MATPNIPGLLLDRAHPLSRGLVAWYPINEGAGRLAADATGINPGTHIADPAWTGAGGRLTGHALTLNGSSQYISVPHSSSISLTADMSMVCWLKVSAWNWHMLFTKTNSGTAGPFMAYVNQVRGTIEFHRGNGTLSSYVESTTPITVNRWECVAATMRGTTVTHYLNGARNGTGTLSTTIGDSGNAMRLGNRPDGFWLSGQMANWRLYNRALSDDEVSHLYANPMAGARAPFSLARSYVYVSRPRSADRLHNRSHSKTYRRGES